MPAKTPKQPPATPDAYEPALRWFRDRLVMTDEEFHEIEGATHEAAFTVAGTTQLDMVTDVWEALDRAMAQGETLGDFQEHVGERLASAWGGEQPWRVENIFRTNLQTAYSAGRYEEMTHPAVKAARPYWRFSAVGDQRTTLVCQECNGTVLPADHPWWDGHYAPLHFQAITGATPIATDSGQVPASLVRPGMLALTHRRQWRYVTAVLHKIVTGRRIRALHLASGRVLRVTEEHPVLVHATPDRLVWRKAGDLQIGDEVLEHGHEMTRAEGARILDADNAPTLAHQLPVTGEIVDAAGGPPVVIPVHLDGDALGQKGEIEHVGANGMLCGGASAKKGEQVLFRWGEFLARGVGPAGAGASPDGRVAHRILFAHTSGGVGPAESPCPVVLSAALGDGGGICHCEPRGVGLASHYDAVAPTPRGERGLPNAEIALDGANAPPPAPVFSLNDVGNGPSVGHVEWHVSTLITIVEELYSGELCDLSVEEDETYVAAGVVVHNCRSHVVTLSEEEATAEGITETPTQIPAMPGFGATPGAGAAVVEDVAPDLTQYPPDLATAYQE